MVCRTGWGHIRELRPRCRTAIINAEHLSTSFDVSGYHEDVAESKATVQPDANCACLPATERSASKDLIPSLRQRIED